MASQSLFVALLALPGAIAYPWVARVPGVNSDFLPTHTIRNTPIESRDSPQCPNNPNHVPAVPISSKYPYLGAKDGKQGTGKGGILVPAPGDTDHYYQEPGPLDIRGP